MGTPIIIGRTSFDADALRSMTKDEAVKHYNKFRKETVLEAHRIATKKKK